MISKCVIDACVELISTSPATDGFKGITVNPSLEPVNRAKPGAGFDFSITLAMGTARFGLRWFSLLANMAVMVSVILPCPSPARCRSRQSRELAKDGHACLGSRL